MKIYFNPSNDPAFNLALEECMTKALSGPALMLWRNSSAVIVGRNQNTLAEVDPDALRKYSVALVRRMTGGGAVYHDLGNLNYSCMAVAGTGPFAAFDAFAAPVMDALRSFGLAVEFSGRNDILLDGRKISGTAKCLFGNRVLFHGTLLFDTDMELLAKVLTPDPEKVAFKGIRSVRSRVANIREYLPGMTSEEFPRAMLEALLKTTGETELAVIPSELIREAEALASAKYRTWEWNFGGSPAFGYHRKGRFAGGSVMLELDVRHGLIEEARITGDFFGERPVSELSEALRGIPFRREDVERILANRPLGGYMLHVTDEEFLSLFE